MRRVYLVGSVILLLAGLGLAGVALFVSRGPALPEGRRALPGLGGTAEVMFDSLGVPHVWAESIPDALFVQGYLHATDRLWQMETYRRVTEGRLSELFGETALNSDRFLRTLNLRQLGEASLSALDGDSRALVEAYVRGVNAAIDSWQGPLPPEFLLLRIRPEPWDAAHTASMEKIMAWDLAAYGVSLSLAESRNRLGEERFRQLLPRYPDWGPAITDAGVVGEAARGGSGHKERRDAGLPPPPSTAVLASARLPLLAGRLLESGSVVRASNSWVVGGERSRSGKPLLANDMHLQLNAPVLWYLIGLHAPGMDVVGMSLPGAPGVVAGHSAAVAWGFTNAMVDDSDFFMERLDPSDSTRYLTPGGSEAFRTRREQIHVRGRDTPIDFLVRETRHGPILASTSARTGGELLAFRWSAQDPSTTFAALLRMSCALSAWEFIDALASFTDPHQNVVFADTAGTFGYWMAGTIPIRRSGRPPLLPVPGWDEAHDWIGTLPFELHPHLLAPSSGRIVTANNLQSRDSVVQLIADGLWQRPYRAMRIEESLGRVPIHDVTSMMAVQLDVGSAFVERYRPSAVRAFRNAGLDEAASSLERWDGRASIESREASIFFTWIEGVRSGLRTDLYGEDRGYLPLYVVEEALDRQDGLTDEVGVAAARAALASADDSWGSLHQLVLTHPLASVPALGRLMGFRRAPLPRPGSYHSPNVADFSGRAPPFSVTHGPSQRHVVDLGDVDGAGGFILPGGQSGYPRSPHSRDQLKRWRGGELWMLPLAREKVETRSVSRLRLVPDGEPGTP